MDTFADAFSLDPHGTLGETLAVAARPVGEVLMTLTEWQFASEDAVDDGLYWHSEVRNDHHAQVLGGRVGVRVHRAKRGRIPPLKGK